MHNMEHVLVVNAQLTTRLWLQRFPDFAPCCYLPLTPNASCMFSDINTSHSWMPTGGARWAEDAVIHTKFNIHSLRISQRPPNIVLVAPHTRRKKTPNVYRQRPLAPFFGIVPWARTPTSRDYVTHGTEIPQAITRHKVTRSLACSQRPLAKAFLCPTAVPGVWQNGSWRFSHWIIEEARFGYSWCQTCRRFQGNPSDDFTV